LELATLGVVRKILILSRSINIRVSRASARRQKYCNFASDRPTASGSLSIHEASQRHFILRMAESVAALFPERSSVPSNEEMAQYIRIAMDVQKRGMSMGKRPFGAILVGPDVTPIL
jgi:hypothetical protein